MLRSKCDNCLNFKKNLLLHQEVRVKISHFLVAKNNSQWILRDNFKSFILESYQ